MSSQERVVVSDLSDRAWNRVQDSFFNPEYEGSILPQEVIAGDGALWRHFYFETLAGPAISLVRETDDTVTSYALQPTDREVALVSVNRRASFTEKITDMGFQEQMGMTIPTGDDLRLLEAFLIPEA